MEDHIHLADGPDLAIRILTEQLEIANIPTMFLNIIFGEDQHTARTNTGIVDTHAFLGLKQTD